MKTIEYEAIIGRKSKCIKGFKEGNINKIFGRLIPDESNSLIMGLCGYFRKFNYLSNCGAHTNAKTIEDFKKEIKRKNVHGSGKRAYIGLEIHTDHSDERFIEGFKKVIDSYLKNQDLEVMR